MIKTGKTIVIGSDDAGNLVTILSCIREGQHYDLQMLTASRLVDLISITNDAQPDLIIINFKDNQTALNNINEHIKKAAIPVLCLDIKNQYSILNWDINSIVFVYPFEMVKKEFYLISRINSIFLLKSNRNVGRNNGEASFVSDKNNNEMSRYVMELDRKKEILYKVKDRIKALYPNVNNPIRSELMSIVNFIKATSNDQKLWDDFKLFFEHTNQDFLRELTKKHPVLTPTDLKYCCYLKMNMSNHDIREVFGINQESVRTHTYRLKLKMALSKEEDLRYYLRSVC